MSDRLPSGVVVSAMLRRVHDAGGAGAVLARGDAQAGAILVVLAERGGYTGMTEAAREPGGAVILVPAGPDGGADHEAVTLYWQRRRARDPDLWVVELDIPQAERFAAETITGG